MALNKHDVVVSYTTLGYFVGFHALCDFEGILDPPSQRQRRPQVPVARDVLKTRRVPLSLRRDNLEGGPLVWTALYGGSYSNVAFGRFIPYQLRRWAYVLWIVFRLEPHGGKDMLKRQWDENSGRDSRDDL